MAHFRGTIHGNRGTASRLDSKNSGLYATVNGWNSGITVSASVNEKGEDEFIVTLTSGSNHRLSSRHLGNFTVADLENKS